MHIEGLEIVYPPDPHTIVLCLVGRMPGEAIPQAEELCKGLMEKGRPWVVIDLSRASYISDEGVGMLAFYDGYLRSLGGGMAVVAPPPSVVSNIHKFNLARAVNWCQTRDQALGELAKARAGQAEAKA